MALACRFLALLGLGLAYGCAAGGWENHEWFLHRKGVAVESPQKFQVCHGYGCEWIESIALTPEEWQGVRAPFANTAATAREERRQIAQSAALYESLLGARIGSDRDLSGTFRGGGGSGQLDCVDETVNTTVLLSLLRRDGLLLWHGLRGPAGRGHFLGGWPHQSAVIVETATGEEYAIDTWFHDNGVPAEVVPLEAWLDGWSPPGFEDSLI